MKTETFIKIHKIFGFVIGTIGIVLLFKIDNRLILPIFFMLWGNNISMMYIDKIK